jgi:hypothetical protein
MREHMVPALVIDARFGLVRAAPEFLVWAKCGGTWAVVGGSDRHDRARTIAAALGGKILPRGQHPVDAGKQAKEVAK